MPPPRLPTDVHTPLPIANLTLENKLKRTALISTICVTALLTGCAAIGDRYAANAYSASNINKRQEVHAVKIIAILPATVVIDNKQAKDAAKIGAALLGAIIGGATGHSIGDRSATNTTIGAVAGGVGGAVAGSLIPDTALVKGVQLTYSQEGKTFNSVQVGQMCEFKPGNALLISTGGDETRIQPNSECPHDSI